MSNNVSSNGLDGDNMFAPYNQLTMDLSLVGDLESEFATSTLDPEDEVINVTEPIPFATAMEAIHIRDYDVILKEKGNLTTDDFSDFDNFFATPPTDGGFGMISDSEPNTFAASMEATRIRIRDYDVIIKESGNTRTTDGSKLYKQVRDNTCTRRQDQNIVKVLREYHKAYNKEYEQVCPTPTFLIRKDYAVEHDQKHPEEKPFLDSKNKKDNYYFDREKFKGVQYIRATRFCILDDLIKCARNRKRDRKRPKISPTPSIASTASTEVVFSEVVRSQPRFDLDHLSTLNEDATIVIKEWKSLPNQDVAILEGLITQFWEDVETYRILFGGLLQAAPADLLQAVPEDLYENYRQKRHERNLLYNVNAVGNAMLDWYALQYSPTSQSHAAKLPPPGGSSGENNRHGSGNSNQDGFARDGNLDEPPSDDYSFSSGSGGSTSQQEDGDYSCSNANSVMESDTDSADGIDLHSGSSRRTSRTDSLTLGSSKSGSLAFEAPSRTIGEQSLNLDGVTSLPSISSGRSCNEKVTSVEAQHDIPGAIYGVDRATSVEPPTEIPAVVHSLEKGTSVEVPSDIPLAVHSFENVVGCDDPEHDAVNEGMRTAEVNLTPAPKKSSKWKPKIPAMLRRHLKGKQEKTTNHRNTHVEIQAAESAHPSSAILTDPIKILLQDEKKREAATEGSENELTKKFASQLVLQEMEVKVQNQQKPLPSRASSKLQDVPNGDPASSSIPSSSQELELIVQLQANMLHAAKIESKSTPNASLASLGPESSREAPDRKARMLKFQEKTRSDFYATSLQESSDNEEEELRKALAASLYFD